MQKTAPSHNSLEGDSPAHVVTSADGVLLPPVTRALHCLPPDGFRRSPKVLRWTHAVNRRTRAE
jgi:hypothetical protein